MRTDCTVKAAMMMRAAVRVFLAPLQIFHGLDVAWIGGRADDSRYAGVVLDVNARGERARKPRHQGVT